LVVWGVTFKTTGSLGGLNVVFPNIYYFVCFLIDIV